MTPKNPATPGLTICSNFRNPIGTYLVNTEVNLPAFHLSRLINSRAKFVVYLIVTL